jgi:8-oxo-dGTP pyrophosphatase MutT (NUDIX family)
LQFVDADHSIEELNPGPPSEPRPAAAVVLLRRGGRHTSRGLEVLMGKRTPAAKFMANVWVFPGGAVDTLGSADPSDRDFRQAALRELEEEASIRLEDPDALVPFSRWVTPEAVKTRYDTRFFLALAPAHSAPKPDGREIVDVGWFKPQQALDRHGLGEMELVFPTIKTLEVLRGFESAEEALSAEHWNPTEPVLPRVVVIDGQPRILLPWEPGYEKGSRSRQKR